MKNTLQIALVFVGVILLGIAVTYIFRMAASVSTPINLHSPKAGVTCAYITTADGAAISCWKD